MNHPLSQQWSFYTFRGELIDKTSNVLQCFPNKRRTFVFLGQPCVLWRECTCLLPWKQQESKKKPFSPVPDVVQLLCGQKADSFSFFLAVIPAFVHVLLYSISQIHFYRLFSASHSFSSNTTLPKDHTGQALPPHRQVMLHWWRPALQVRAASKISKTEEGVNERPTVTSEVICFIKEREDFMLYVPIIQRETDTMATSLSGSSRALL